MEIITIINQKGGVGKTTTAHSIGMGLNQRGYKVLMMDLDSQKNLSYLMQEAAGTGKNIVNVLENYKSINENIIQVKENLFFIWGDVRAATYQLESNEVLKKAIEQITIDLDYIIIDTAPTLSRLTINSLVASDKIIIPTQADIFSLKGLQQFYKTYMAVANTCKVKAVIDGILITRYNKRTNISKVITEMLEDTAKTLNTKVYKTKIRECTAIREAQATKTNIFKKKSNAREDYNNLINEIIKPDNTVL